MPEIGMEHVAMLTELLEPVLDAAVRMRVQGHKLTAVTIEVPMSLVIAVDGVTMNTTGGPIKVTAVPRVPSVPYLDPV